MRTSRASNELLLPMCGAGVLMRACCYVAGFMYVVLALVTLTKLFI